MAAPTFVSFASTTPISLTTSPLTLSITTLAGDYVVAYAFMDGGQASFTISGNSLDWNSIGTNREWWTSSGEAWWAKDPAGGTAWTLSIGSVPSGLKWTIGAWVWRGVSVVGSTVYSYDGDGVFPQKTLSVPQVDSAILFAAADFNAIDGTGRTFLQINGASPTEDKYERLVNSQTIYAARYANAGPAGAKVAGLSAPQYQSPTSFAVELRGVLAADVGAPVSKPLAVEVDWNRDGDYSDAGEDVTGRVRGTVECTFGRDQVTALSPIVAGRGSFELDNRSRDYSPLNTGSPLFGKVKPARPVLIRRTVGSNVYTIFRSHTDDSAISPDVEAKRVRLGLVDFLADFRGQRITTQLYQGIRTGEAIGEVLNAIGWTGARDIDPGATFIPFWWEEGADAFDALQRILASEGPPSLLSVGTTGELIFRDRHHRFTRAASTAVQSTWRGSGAEPVMNRGYSYSDNWENIVNAVSFTVSERQPRDEARVWETEEIISLAASEARVIVMETSDPFYGAQTPIAGLDFAVLSGSITNVFLSRTSGQSTSVTLLAGGSGAVVGGLAVRATSVPVARTAQITATNSASIAEYGRRSLPGGLEPVWASRYDARSIADLLMAQRAQPLPQLQVRFVCGRTQNARLDALLSLDLSDRVRVVEPETAVSGDYFVESIGHAIEGVTSHEITFGLEAVPAAPAGTQFIIGTSTLNGTHVLAY